MKTAEYGYCSYCGKAMILRPKKEGYSTEDGKPWFVDYRECPRYRQYWRPSTFMVDLHDRERWYN